MRFSGSGLFGILLAIAMVVAAFLKYSNQGLLEIIVVVVYTFILLLTNNAHEEEPSNTNKKWLISLFLAGIINLIAIILAPIVIPTTTADPTAIIFVAPFVSLIIGTLFTFLVIQS